MPKDESSKNTTSDILLAGAFAAFTVDILVYPLDTLKTRIQSKDFRARYVSSTTNAINKPILFRGLYQGIASVVIATLPSSGAFFLTYESIKYVLKGENSPLPVPVAHSAASAIAELVSCAILTPAEVIKQNAQMASSSSASSQSLKDAAKSLTDVAKSTPTLDMLRRFRSQPSALFRGYFALAARNLPFTALQFPMFEALRNGIAAKMKREGKWHDSLWEKTGAAAVSAGAAGGVAALVTTPMDVVKTRVMLDAGEANDGSNNNKGQKTKAGKQPQSQLKDATGQAVQGSKKASGGGKQGLPELRMAKEIWKDGGMRALFRGGALRVVWTMMGSGLYLGTYEYGLAYLAKRREDI